MRFAPQRSHANCELLRGTASEDGFGDLFSMKPLAVIVVAISVSLCASESDAADTVLKVDYYDFLENGTPAGTYGGHLGVGQPDFQNQSCGLATGLVQSTLVNRKPVFASSTGSNAHCASIASYKSFHAWFKAQRAVNTHVKGALTLQDMGNGTFQYSNLNFFPLDGKGFNTDGSQSHASCTGGLHNFSFTMQAHWTGTITNNAQSISITAADDVWLFVNNKLVIDLGGVHGATTGSISFSSVELASLGMSLNQAVPFDLFYANRHTCLSAFTLTMHQ
ncbi:MAG TPA: fibro-slime domain-containing protein [Rhizomicrobium sp.]|nr:fibro-slime domain-containing protein [Rhizomicrobium sp.]